MFGRAYYFVDISDQDGNVRTQRSKKTVSAQIGKLSYRLIDFDAFSSLARQLRVTDSLARIRWFVNERQIGSTGWFPVSPDPEVIEHLKTK